MMGRSGIGGFAHGLAQGINQGTDLMMKGAAYKDHMDKRRALDAYSALPAYDPEAMNQTPEGFVGPPELDAGVAWDQHVEKQLAAARAINPEFELALRPILQEQHMRMASTAMSQAGFYASSGQLEPAQKFADRFTQLIAPGEGYRVTAELVDPDETGNPVVAFRGADGQYIDTNAMLDALGKMKDPLEWEKTKAYIQYLLSETERKAAATDAAGRPDAPATLTPKDRIELGQAAVQKASEGGVYPDDVMDHLSTDTKGSWLTEKKVPPFFRPLWDAATGEILYTMGDGVSGPDEAAYMGFILAATLENTGPGAKPLTYSIGEVTRPGDIEPSVVLIATMPDGADAAIGWESNTAKRLRKRFGLDEALKEGKPFTPGVVPQEPEKTEEPKVETPAQDPQRTAIPPQPNIINQAGGLVGDVVKGALNWAERSSRGR